MTPRRLLDWPERLHRCFDEAATRAYRLGDHDCLTFAADCVLAIVGHVALHPRGLYSTRRGMRARLAAMGGSIQAAVSRVLGEEPVPIRLARRGDLLWRKDGHGVEHIAVCAGAVGIAPAPQGLAVRPLDDFSACWRIG